MLSDYRKHKRLKTVLAILFAMKLFSAEAQSCCNPGCSCGQNDIAPAGIMNDHLHDKGEWMVSYRYMHTDMQSNIVGAQSVSDGDIFNSYLMSQGKMTMDMHMLMVMYGLNAKITLMAMPSYTTSVMLMKMYGNAPMQMPDMAPNTVMPNSQTVSGLGDTKLYALCGIVRTSHINLVASAGLSLPTGSIN